MAIEKFIPQSPDKFIRNTKDFEVARFGHLNTVIDYINNSTNVDSLQLEGSGPITSTARYITDNSGVASAMSISTTRVGIGTNTPLGELHIDGHNGFGASLRITTNKVGGVAYIQMISDYVTGFEQYQYGGPGWGWPNWTTTRAGGTAAAPTAVPNNYGLNEYSFWGHDGTSAGQAYSMMTRASETWTTSAHGIYTIFYTTKTGATALTERMRFSGTGNVTFNNASDTAQVSIKGSGSTSATTALLVQNSGGTETFSLRDDGVAFFRVGGVYTQIQGNLIYFNGGSATLSENYFKSYINGFSIGTIPAYQFNLITNDTPRLTIDGTGNVGIGTTSPTEKLTINTGNLLFTTTGDSIIYGIRNGVNQDTRIIINDQTTGGLTLGAKYGNPSGCIYFQCGLGAYTERMRLTPNGNLLIGNTTDNARLSVTGSGSTSATTSLLVQNSSSTNLLQVTDDGQTIVNGASLYIRQPGYAGQISIFQQGNNISRINGGNSESIVFGQGGNTININATETYVSSSFLGSGFWMQNNGATVLGAQAMAHASALLDIRSTTRGFLPPRMTTAQRDAIATPATGLKVYNTTTNTTDTYDGATWQRFGQQTFIKGSGSTSATTSLLVQNSGGNTALQVRDDRVTSIYNQLKVFDQFDTLILDTQNSNGGIQVGNTSLGSGSGRSYDIIQNNTNPYGGIRFFSDNARSVRTGWIWIDGPTNNFQIQTTTTDVTNQSALIANSSSLYLGYLTYNPLPASAAVAIQSTTRGFLPSRMTTTQKNAISSPASGLIVYDTTTNKLCCYNGTSWNDLF